MNNIETYLRMEALPQLISRCLPVSFVVIEMRWRAIDIGKEELLLGNVMKLHSPSKFRPAL
jgi:hypothetical protein